MSFKATFPLNLAGLGVILALIPPAMADVVIDFGPSFGAPVSGHVVLTNQLQPWGVTFSTTDPEGVFWYGGNQPWAPRAYSISAGATAGLNVPACIDPIRVDFNIPVLEASIRGFNGGGDTDTLILNAYDGGGTLVDSDTITSVFDTPGHTASVSGSAISYITFEVSVPGDHGLFFDDLAFEPVPAPGAAFLGVLGLGLVGWCKRWLATKP